jgi:hypothetical protein
MIGDANDFKSRLMALLPLRWFADTTPVASALLAGISDGWTWLYGQLGYVGLQTRIATATDSFLDLISQDYLGATLPRKFGETDASFRARIQREMFRARATRPALVAELTNLTGRAPAVFEPTRPADTGAWGHMLGYNRAGGWGSLMMPFQVFVTAYRPLGTGLPFVGGWGSIPIAHGVGGWNGGAIEYASIAMVQNQVTDADINTAIATTVPVAVTAWTRISN